MGRRAFLPVVAIVALLAAGLGLWAAAPAFAAPKPIGLSADGITFADDLPASLFAGAHVVPGDTEMRSFWIQNRAAGTGNVAVALQGVTGIDSVMISALSIHAVAGPSSGPVVPFTAANPCRSLVSGVGLAAGGIVRVDVTLAVAPSLSGKTSQRSVGAFDLRVTMTSTDVAAPNGCAAVGPSTPGDIGSTIISGAADGAIPDGGGLPDLSGSGDGVAAGIIEPNTSRFFQELFVVGWLIAMVLGGIVAWWRRRNDPEDAYR